MLKILSFLLLFLVPDAYNQPYSHEFYISKCLIEYVESQKSIQVTLHVFLDDLERGLANAGYEDLHLTEENELPAADSLLEVYLLQHFAIKANQENVGLSLLGKELSDDYAALWCYLEALPVQPPASISVKNSLLTEIYDDQQNIINIKYSGKEEAFFILSGRETEKTTSFIH